jgi:hypothetical protein
MVLQRYQEELVGLTIYMHRDSKQAYKIVVGKPEGNRLFRGLRHRWMDNIKM